MSRITAHRFFVEFAHETRREDGWVAQRIWACAMSSFLAAPLVFAFLRIVESFVSPPALNVPYFLSTKNLYLIVMVAGLVFSNAIYFREEIKLQRNSGIIDLSLIDNELICFLVKFTSFLIVMIMLYLSIRRPFICVLFGLVLCSVPMIPMTKPKKGPE